MTEDEYSGYLVETSINPNDPNNDGDQTDAPMAKPGEVRYNELTKSMWYYEDDKWIEIKEELVSNDLVVDSVNSQETGNFKVGQVKYAPADSSLFYFDGYTWIEIKSKSDTQALGSSIFTDRYGELIDTKIDLDDDVQLNNILFDNDEIVPTSLLEINNYAKYLEHKDNNKTVLLFGSTDSRGSAFYNYYLSARRAQFVKEKLYDRAGKLTKIVPVALGKSMAVVNRNLTPEEARSVFLRCENLAIPYNMLLAIPAEDSISEDKLAVRFKCDKDILIKINDVLRKDKLSNLYFVGIHSIHKVKASETLYAIAKLYDCALESLMLVNNLKDANILIGRRLIIPVK